MSENDMIRRGAVLAEINRYRSEWDYAREAIVALPAADLERAWQPIETAPDDDGLLHVRGVWVHDRASGKRLYFDAVAGYLEDGEFVTASGDHYGWRPEDYTHWMPIPPPPADLAQRVKE